VFGAIAERFGEFGIDTAADEHNHLCECWMSDALHIEWGYRNWCNPPFGDITPWVRKAASWVPRGHTIMLTPSNAASAWFRLASSSATLILPSRRIQFWHPDEEPGSPDRDTVIWWFGGPPRTVDEIEIPEHSAEVRRLCEEASGQLSLAPQGSLL
jgi:hypothetical protein